MPENRHHFQKINQASRPPPGGVFFVFRKYDALA
jgi:hypothetical protein